MTLLQPTNYIICFYKRTSKGIEIIHKASRRSRMLQPDYILASEGGNTTPLSFIVSIAFLSISQSKSLIHLISECSMDMDLFYPTSLTSLPSLLLL